MFLALLSILIVLFIMESRTIRRFKPKIVIAR